MVSQPSFWRYKIGVLIYTITNNSMKILQSWEGTSKDLRKPNFCFYKDFFVYTGRSNELLSLLVGAKVPSDKFHWRDQQQSVSFLKCNYVTKHSYFVWRFDEKETKETVKKRRLKKIIGFDLVFKKRLKN